MEGALYSSSPPSPPCDVFGAVLIGIPAIDNDDNSDDDKWTETDFTSILAAIRGVAPSGDDHDHHDGSIVLLFRYMSNKNIDNDNYATTAGVDGIKTTFSCESRSSY